MAKHDDLFIRDDLSDTGEIPSGVRTAYRSPDIVPVGQSPLEHPETLATPASYSTDPGTNILASETNYIYGRCKNLYSSPSRGYVYLYYMLNSLLAQPSEWKKNKITTSSGGDCLEIPSTDPTKIIVAKGAWRWSPTPPPTNRHYCVVARIVTDRYPNPIPEDFASCSEFVQWVVGHASVAWRNVSVIPNRFPPDWQQGHRFESMDEQPRKYAVNVNLINFGSQADGTHVGMVCAQPGPDPAINKEGFVTKGDDDWYLYTETLLPSLFSGVLDVTIHLRQGVWPQGGDVHVNIDRIVEGEHTEILRRYARSGSELGYPREAADRQLVRLGSYTLRVVGG